MSRKGEYLLTEGKGTTAIGYTNRNNQTVLSKTNIPGTDHGQTVYKLPASRYGSRPWSRR
jgi:hypothetical protein